MTEKEKEYWRGYNDAVGAAAARAEQWDHRGDPGEAMYAAPRIRDRILLLKKPI